jgi:hypothetical protein
VGVAVHGQSPTARPRGHRSTTGNRLAASGRPTPLRSAGSSLTSHTNLLSARRGDHGRGRQAGAGHRRETTPHPQLPAHIPQTLNPGSSPRTPYNHRCAAGSQHRRCRCRLGPPERRRPGGNADQRRIIFVGQRCSRCCDQEFKRTPSRCQEGYFSTPRTSLAHVDCWSVGWIVSLFATDFTSGSRTA